MCKTHNPRVIDKCMRILINYIDKNYKVLACCCGHNRYPMTIVVNYGGNIFDIISQQTIQRKKRFYVKDKQGYYYIPETTHEKE
jgi:hypothetical protein